MARREALRIGVIMKRASGSSERVMWGIARYAHLHGPWSFYTRPQWFFAELPPLDQWKGDGVIAVVGNEQVVEEVNRRGLPTVNVSGFLPDPGLPTVVTDNRAVGRLAAEHFIERGHRVFGYCGFASLHYANERWIGFKQGITEAGHASPPAYIDVPTGIQQHYESPFTRRQIAQWVRELPKPAAVLTANDLRAQQLLEVARESGVAVPEDLALVGVDNEQIRCVLADPPLSSVDLPYEQIGYEAAKMLDAVIAGGSPEPSHRELPPLGVVTRQSSDIMAIADPHVAKAVHLINRHACERITVAQIVGAMPVSRRRLEARFRALRGRSMRDEIVRVRIRRARQLLRDSDMSIPQIAAEVGCATTSELSRMFRQKVGRTPSEYRSTEMATFRFSLP